MSNEKVDLINANGSSKALKIADMIYINYYCSYEDKENKCSLYNINNAIYSLFLTLIDRKSRYRLRIIDLRIKVITNFIKNRTNWDISRCEGTLYDNVVKAKDPEFNSCSVHRVIRDRLTSGYESVRYNDSKAHLFVTNYKYELDYLHDLYCLKESIMCGEYSVINSSQTELCHVLCDYLGYIKEVVPRKLIKDE